MNRAAVFIVSAMLAWTPVRVAAGLTFHAFRPGEVKVGGEIGRRMNLNANKLLHHIDVEKVFFKGFRERKNIPDMWGGFSGWGMALDAIVKAAAHGVGGAEMIRFKEHWISETMSVQASDGSISMFRSDPGVWDSHEQAYLIQALCLDHRYFGKDESLKTARRLAEYLMKKGASVNLGLETAFVLLYEETKDIRFADYCRDRFLIEKDNASYDTILPENGVVHVYTFIQRALAQMQYASATGRSSTVLPLAADDLFRRVFDNYISVSGSISGSPLWGELWDGSQIGLGKWGETCATAYLLRAIVERMKTHPCSVLGDLYERVLYNAFFGAQSSDGSKQRYFIPFNEKGEWFDRETYCCPNNLRRMVFEIPEAVFFKTADGFALNLFTPAVLDAKGLNVVVETDYPADGRVVVKIKSDQPGVIRMRIPLWTGLIDAGQWRQCPYGKGYTELGLAFEMPVRLVKGRVAQTGKVAVLRGPVVYGLETEEGWHGHVDAYAIDSDSPIGWNGEGVTLTMVSQKYHHARTNLVLRPFASDRRERTYFPKTGHAWAIDDELFRPVALQPAD